MERLIYGAGIFILAIALSACGEQSRNTPADSPGLPESPSGEPAAGTSREKSFGELRENLVSEGYQVFDYVDEKTGDTVLMQQYFMAFLKRGGSRSQSQEEADSLQQLHLAHLGRMYELGYADISGPFGDDGDIRGVTIYNVPTLEMADSLARLDPAVRAGRLEIEIHPWWAAKGFPLR
ncbi:YciI family protein [Robiginitalea biformata]|uniref:Phenylalanyl-tRNA synthetase alpha subunit n=1 Tax=Robiginitalea biformata (strain ATCC BAA-864 / DSM 15991 / KCTC 12146 / HTCC2501) TaxID=313596 RepID=A4CII4_ROBBH|nr:YciI family protein [Robiginitalea biformata]EAR16742.1 phenylalanyl-tRNA synthetase alpha subunit [Robiginitalea biformata HTCC2501]